MTYRDGRKKVSRQLEVWTMVMHDCVRRRRRKGNERRGRFTIVTVDYTLAKNVNGKGLRLEQNWL